MEHKNAVRENEEEKKRGSAVFLRNEQKERHMMAQVGRAEEEGGDLWSLHYKACLYI